MYMIWHPKFTKTCMGLLRYHHFIPCVLLLQGLHEIEVSRNRSGTSIGLGGDFVVSLDGARSQYLPSNASARDLKLALEALDTVGTVDVERYDGDEEVRGLLAGGFVSSAIRALVTGRGLNLAFAKGSTERDQLVTVAGLEARSSH